MQENNTALIDSGEGLHDAYRVTEPGEIIRVLQQIHQQQNAVLMVLPRDRKMVTMLLEVNPESAQFVYESGRNQDEKQAILSAPKIRFISSIQGITVRFTVPTPVETMFLESPALLSPFPIDMQRFQRREYYRAPVKLNRSYQCTLRLRDQTSVSLNIKDISLGGVKLQSSTVAPEVLAVGALLQGATLDFMELGKLEVNLFVTSHLKSSEENVTNYLYGCQFQQLPKRKEAAIQKLVFSLERLNRSSTLTE